MCNWCNSSCQNVVSEFFAMSPPYPTHRILNSCFDAFHSAGVHLGLFRYGSELGAKRAEQVQLMQKFVPQSNIGVIRSKCPRSTPLTLNSCFGAFHSVWVHLELFLYYKKLGAKRAELVQLMRKFVRQSCVGMFCNGRTRSTPLEPKLMFCCVL